MPLDFKLLAEFSLDSWLLARSTRDTCMSPVDGRAWEQAVGDLLRRAPLPNRQRAGLTTLFGVQAASGVAHELDACAAGAGTLIVVECKSQTSGVAKADAALFHEKTLDFFSAKPGSFCSERWWRVVVSSTPVSYSVRAFCVNLGLVLTEPNHLPLPVVLRVASRPGADMHLREALLQDAVHLAERALVPLQDKWRYDTQTDEIRFQPTTLSPTEIQELLWLQEELGSDILDLYDLHHPGTLEHRAEELFRTLRPSRNGSSMHKAAPHIHDALCGRADGPPLARCLGSALASMLT